MGQISECFGMDVPESDRAGLARIVVRSRHMGNASGNRNSVFVTKRRIWKKPGLEGIDTRSVSGVKKPLQ